MVHARGNFGQSAARIDVFALFGGADWHFLSTSVEHAASYETI